MEQRRRAERNKIDITIKDAIRYHKADEQTIFRLKNLSETEYTVNQLEKLQEGLAGKKRTIQEMEQRLRDLALGKLDEEILADSQRTRDEIKAKEAENKRRHNAVTEEKKDRQDRSQKFWNQTVQNARQNRFDKRDADRSYRYFLKTCGSIPDYMRKNLADMPNNKGYIWKGIYCYGERLSERGKPTVLFEKQRGGVLRINEWSNTEYKIYDKEGKNRKILVSKTIRRKPTSGTGSLMDYLVK